LTRIQLTIQDEVIVCELLTEVAPVTCEAIQALLPYEADLHYAKIAGEEILFGVPLMLPLEHRQEVHGLPAGSVVYWPNRQVFCLYYGAPQEEAATVTVFAHVVGNLEGLRRVGEGVRLRQGASVRVERMDEPATREGP